MGSAPVSIGSAIQRAFSAPRQPDVMKVDLKNEESVRRAIAKSKADLRSLSVALESYNIDWNGYPQALAPNLTTPIAYITQVPYDPFAPQPKPMQYQAAGKSWKLWSLGPDQQDGKAAIQYDPTNGTLSGGDVIQLPR